MRKSHAESFATRENRQKAQPKRNRMQYALQSAKITKKLSLKEIACSMLCNPLELLKILA